MMLCLGEAHAVFLLVTILVGEDDHEILAGEVVLQFVGKTLEGVLVGNGALTGGDDDEEMVVGNVGGELRQFVPVGHGGVFGTYRGMVVVDVFGNEGQRLVAAVELYAAVEFAGEAREAFEPAVEAGFILGTAGYGHPYAAEGIERLNEAREHNLAVQAVVEALDEIAPELGVLIGMDVHTHDDLGTSGLAEGVFDAVGDVGGEADWCL